jgi:WD40 repeat protein
LDFNIIPGFSPDGATLAGGSAVRIGQWRVSDGTYLNDITAYNSPVTAVAWSRDNQFVATGANGMSVLAVGRLLPASARVWNAATGSLLATLTLPTGDSTVPSGVAFSNDNQTLAVSYWNGSGSGYAMANLYFYRISDGTLLNRVAGGGSLAVSPDGTMIAVAVSNTMGGFPALRIYRMSDFGLLRDIPGSFNGYGVAFSPDNQHVFASGGTGGLTVNVFQFQASSGALARTFTSSPSVFLSRIAISPDGQTLAAANGAGNLSPVYPGTFLFRISDGTQLAAWNANIYGVRGLSFSPDSQYLAAGGDDAVLNFYRISDGTVVARYDQETGSSRAVGGLSEWTNIRELLWAPDGSRLLYSRFDATAVMMATPIPALNAVSGPSPIVAGTTVNGTVTLTQPALPGGFVVNLSSSSTRLTVPPSATVPAGSTSALFSMTAGSVGLPTTANITATAGTVTKMATVTINPSTPPWLTALTAAPAVVVGGAAVTGTVTLNTVAPPGGSTISLASKDPAASVPASVPVPAGSTSATFPITTHAVSAQTPVVITATYRGGTLGALLVVRPPALANVVMPQAAVTGGRTTNANQVRLSVPAPAGGITVALTSANPTVAAVPATVLVPAGAAFATFSITTTYVTAVTQAVISASYNGVTRQATLTVNPLAVTSVNLSASSTTGGTVITGNLVVLNGPAPAGGAVVTLSSSNTPVAVVPASVTVPAGAGSASFGIRTFSVTSQKVVSIGAAYGSSTASSALTVNP